ncbi:MAG: adenosylmethionine decarboxylase [Salinarimonas sp.]
MNGHGLDDEDRIEQAFRDCVDECGATLLHIHTHKFSPQGVSGVAVLAESHISVHTWPEIGYGAFDVFMCGDADPWRAVDVLKAAFGTADVRVRELLRGEGLVEAVEHAA